jgi:hypothetical protein
MVAIHLEAWPMWAGFLELENAQVQNRRLRDLPNRDAEGRMPGKKKRPRSEEMSNAAARGGQPSDEQSRSYTFRGRTIEVVPPSRDAKTSLMKGPPEGMLSIDGRQVAYEQTEEGVYSHEMMYARFSTPEELAEELVRQWGTSIPAPMDMSMHDHGTPKKSPEGPTRPPGRHHPK